MSKRIVLACIGVMVSFVLVVFGFLEVFPLYIATPLLFVSIFYILFHVNNRKRFKGFKKITG